MTIRAPPRPPAPPRAPVTWRMPVPKKRLERKARGSHLGRSASRASGPKSRANSHEVCSVRSRSLIKSSTGTSVAWRTCSRTLMTSKGSWTRTAKTRLLSVPAGTTGRTKVRGGEEESHRSSKTVGSMTHLPMRVMRMKTSVSTECGTPIVMTKTNLPPTMKRGCTASAAFVRTMTPR